MYCVIHLELQSNLQPQKKVLLRYHVEETEIIILLEILLDVIIKNFQSNVDES